MIASITDSKDTCECVANSQARQSLCSVPLKIAHNFTKTIKGNKSSPFPVRKTKYIKSLNSCRFIIHHY